MVGENPSNLRGPVALSTPVITLYYNIRHQDVLKPRDLLGVVWSHLNWQADRDVWHILMSVIIWGSLQVKFASDQHYVQIQDYQTPVLSHVIIHIIKSVENDDKILRNFKICLDSICQTCFFRNGTKYFRYFFCPYVTNSHLETLITRCNMQNISKLKWRRF